MHPPDEMMVREFLPSMRHLIGRELRGQGYSQSRIASMLEVTQASVSLYLSSSPAEAYRTLLAFSLDRKAADRLAEALADASKADPVKALDNLLETWHGILGRGDACSRHRSAYPSLADCDVCMKDYGPSGPQAEVVSEVTDAVRQLESSSFFAKVIPEVSANLACAPDSASTPAEVVAVPGRIVKVKDRTVAMLPPRAGASVHLSRVLLAAREVRPEIRACINLRYDERMRRALRSLGLRTHSMESHPVGNDDDPTPGALKVALRRSVGRLDGVIDLGRSGIEPNLYLFSTGAREVAMLALAVAERYSAS